jgi:hypothetical protein
VGEASLMLSISDGLTTRRSPKLVEANFDVVVAR